MRILRKQTARVRMGERPMLKHYVMSDEEIRRSAETLIRAHGGSAGTVCADTAERRRNRGDEAAAELWTRIMHMVRKLERERVFVDWQPLQSR